MSDTALIATMSLRSNTFISRAAYNADSIECCRGKGSAVFHSLIDSLMVRAGTSSRITFATYVFASLCPRTQSPQISFPISQYLTLNGSGLPCIARIAPMLEDDGLFAYSTQATASSAEAPGPSTLTVIDGSAPTLLQRRTNSSVPKSLGSSSFPHERFVHVKR